MDNFLQQLINGLTLGSIYGLIAIGYTMVYGIIGMVNFAHGDVYMVGAFQAMIMLLITSALGISWVPLQLALMLIAAIVLTSAYGWAVERIAYRPLRGSTRLAPLISAIGMSNVLENYVQLLQGPRPKPIEPLIRRSQIDTLVFVPDGALRNIPMAALYDGEKYLVQKYAVAVTPGLTLMEPRPFNKENIILAANGLSAGKMIS